MVAVSAEGHSCKDWTGREQTEGIDRQEEGDPAEKGSPGRGAQKEQGSGLKRLTFEVAIDAKVAGLPGATARPRVFGFTDTTPLVWRKSNQRGNKGRGPPRQRNQQGSAQRRQSKAGGALKAEVPHLECVSSTSTGIGTNQL